MNKLLREIYKGDFLKRKATSSNDPLIGKQFKVERNKTNKAIKRAKRKYFSEILDANKGDPHKTWRFLSFSLHKSKSAELSQIKIARKSSFHVAR